MPSYTLEIEAFGIYTTNMPSLEIWEDGVLDSTHTVSSSGSTISVTINYGGTLPTSLALTFNDGFAANGRTIEIQSVKINDRYVNTGNYLSGDSLSKSQSATVDIASSDYIFNNSADPDPSEFTTGATRTFTAGADSYRDLSGSTDQVFDMLGGADYAYLGSGNDKVSGGAGNDIIRGGAGNDLIFGAADDDRLFGGTGNDTVHGGTGDDRIRGDAGDDEIHGGDGADRLNGGADDDIITGGIGNDQLLGGSGSDYLYGDADNDQLVGGSGDDTLDGGDGDDVLYGGAGADHIDGGDGADELVGNIGADIINGGIGNDTIYVMTNDFAAGEEIYGGAGTDELVLTHASTVDFTTGVIQELETLIGSDDDQDVTYTINQALGFSTIDLAGGTDTSRVQISGAVDVTALGTPTVSNVENGFLTGSGGVDDLTIFGTQLNSLVFGSGIIDFGGGVDTLYLTSTSTDLNTLGNTNTSIVGLENINASAAGAGVTITLNNQVEDFSLTGSVNADTLRGGAGNDTINGGAGDDAITGNAGADIIDGGAGNDRIDMVGGAFTAGESIDGGADIDTIRLTGATTVDFTVGTITNVETLTGVFGLDTYDQDVTYTIQQALDFTTIDLGGGTDNSRVQISGTVDVTALGTPTVSNAENGFLTGSTGNDDVTISGAQLDALVFGTGIIDFAAGTDVLNITSTSADLNSLGSAANASIAGLETISASAAAAGVTIDMSAQTEGFTITGSGFVDAITAGSGADTIDGGSGDDTINLANGDFSAGESLTGGADTDNITLTNATTVDFTIGTIATVEDLIGSTGNDNVTLSVAQYYGFTTIDYAGGTDAQTIDASGVNDVTAETAPTVSNLESSSLLFSAGVDDLTITGTQLDTLSSGMTSIDFLGGADVLNVTSTSANLLTWGTGANADLQGLETISASGAGAGVEISVSGQTEAFTITGGASADTLTGGSAADTIDGGNGDNILTGLDGNDTITGGTGDDTILGGDGDDTLVGGAGDDTIYGATIIGESGVETVVQTNSTTWHTVTFSAAILNPVVKMSNMTNNDGDYYVVRVRDVTETGFEWQIDEFDYLDGSRVLAEDVSWLAVAQGTHTLDNGSVIQAGTTTATNESFTTVTFDSAFGSAPVVMTQVMTDNDSAAVGTRNRNRTTTTFQIQMLEEEANDGTHATEDIGWIAIDNAGSPASGFLVGETGNSVTHNITTVNFGSAFANTPVVLHDQQTRDGGDTSYSQADGVTTSTLDVFIGEEQSANAETNHITEVVGYYALNEGLLTSENGGDNTFTGGAGVDTLYGGDGADTFIFEAANAFVDNDILADFSAGEGDVLDISDLIIGAFSGTITDYVFFDDSSGTDTVVQIDANGLTGGASFQDIATINGVTGLDEATLYTNGNIVV